MGHVQELYRNPERALLASSMVWKRFHSSRLEGLENR